VPPTTESADQLDEDVSASAGRVAFHLTGSDPSFEDVKSRCDAAYRSLLRSVARLGPRFAFDTDGRPGAIEAVRAALPPVERELFEAIVTDHACEIAAVEEALYRVALARR
jgi:hypothetical protein